MVLWFLLANSLWSLAGCKAQSLPTRHTSSATSFRIRKLDFMGYFVKSLYKIFFTMKFLLDCHIVVQMQSNTCQTLPPDLKFSFPHMHLCRRCESSRGLLTLGCLSCLLFICLLNFQSISFLPWIFLQVYCPLFILCLLETVRGNK